MDDDDLKKSVIDQMMGELDDVTADSLKKKPEAGGPVKGVEIAITVSPKSGDMEDAKDEACDDEDCAIPEHGHDDEEEDHDEGNYIQNLLKKLA